jgi:hypothetical protein
MYINTFLVRKINLCYNYVSQDKYVTDIFEYIRAIKKLREEMIYNQIFCFHIHID